MACTVIPKFVCKEGGGKQFPEVLTAMYLETFTKDGFIAIATHVDQDNPDIIFVVEHRQIRYDHEAYMGWKGEPSDVDK